MTDKKLSQLKNKFSQFLQQLLVTFLRNVEQLVNSPMISKHKNVLS